MELMEIEEVQTAPKTELAPIERAAIALESSKTEQHLKALATKHQSITVVKDKAGREQAHGAYIEVMRARTAVDKAAKDAREDATKFSKAVIAEAARLVAIVEPEEARLKEARDAWDEEQARIKAEAEAKERARVLAITERIAAIKSYVVLANNCRTSARVAELIKSFSMFTPMDFEEFAEEAAQAHADSAAHMGRVFSDRQADDAEAARIKAEQEVEAARLKAEREELDRQQAEAAAALKKQQDELAAQRAAAQAQQEAAEKAVAEQRAELERMRAELEAKSKPAEQPVAIHVCHPATDMYEQLSAQAEAAADVPLITGELGVVDAAITIVATPSAEPSPPAIALIRVVAQHWHTDTKTAARWITERAAEIETLKG